MEFKNATMADFDVAFDYIQKLWTYNTYDKEVIRKMFDKIKGKDELMAALVELYNEPMKALFDEPEDDEGNVTWGKNF